MFGDPATNPKGLPTTRLGDVCTRITDGTHQPPAWSATGIPFLFVSNVINGEITFDTEKFISDETYAELTRRCPITVGDVLYSTVGSYGVPAIVSTTRKFAFQRHIAHLKPDRSVLEPEFLRAMLASPPLKRQADRAARGVAQKTVNLADIREFLVLRPPLPLQREFSHRGIAVKQLWTAHHRAASDSDALFSSLQHRAFRGEL
jgi:type I restriction enzyme S subunit